MDGFHFINTSHTGAGSSSFQINAESGGTEGHDYRYADLQAQWMDVVMENEKLAAELEHVKYDEVKSLSSELQAEEERVRELEEQLRANKP
uniref:Uncharacterized protein n=1 Tax=Strigamia maritima TaxID=126957 RepID=T1J735_STRMM